MIGRSAIWRRIFSWAFVCGLVLFLGPAAAHAAQQRSGPFEVAAAMLDPNADRTAGPYDLVLVRPNGRKNTVLVKGRAQGLTIAQRPPAWSPNGRALAFVATRTGGVTDVYLVRADGSGLRQVTRTGDTADPAWSADGQRIFFARQQTSIFSPAGSDIWSIAPDGTHQQQLTSFLNSEFQIPSSVSSDGVLLAFTVQLPPPVAGLTINVSSVRLLDLTHGTSRELAANSSDADFTPGGRSLVLASTRNRDGLFAPPFASYEYYYADLFLIALNGRSIHELTHTPATSEAAPTISSDGSRIVYQSSLAHSRTYHTLFESNLDGSCRTSFGKADTLYYAPSWRPQPDRHIGKIQCRRPRQG